MKANSVKTFLTPRTAQIVGLICGGTIFSGCVLVEKYAAEKARSMNFQRLLAQDERRMTELDSEVKRAKRELAEYERTNWELTAQTQNHAPRNGQCTRGKRSHQGGKRDH